MMSKDVLKEINKNSIKNGKEMKQNNGNKSTENKLTSENKFRADYYTKMREDEFENFCHRLLTLHRTGIYTSPPPKPRICNNKKKGVRNLRKYIPDKKKRLTSFGKGKVGTSCESYGIKNCLCCGPTNESNYRILDNFPQLRSHTSNINNYQLQDTRLSQNNYLNLETLSTDSEYELQNALLQEFEAEKKNSDPILIDSFDMSNNSVICIDDIGPSISVSPEINPTIIDEIVITDSENESTSLNLDLKYALDKTNPSKLARKSHNLLEKMCEDFTTNIQKSFTNNNKTSSVNLRLSDCSVCLEPFKNQEIMSTICGHVFCEPCIKNCIKQTKSCPHCRKRLTLKSIHPLYI